jgi:thioredoxin reductase (NADPH)
LGSVEKLVSLAVDDEPAALSTVVRVLQREYGKQYRVVRADSGISALESLRQLKLRASPFPYYLQVFSE